MMYKGQLRIFIWMESCARDGPLLFVNMLPTLPIDQFPSVSEAAA